MPHVIGRAGGDGQAGTLGAYRAPDGSDGAAVRIDLDRPHACLVVGKRGYGKSYTLGVLAEELARAVGVAPVVLDPMGVFHGLADGDADSPVPATVVASPSVTAGSLPPRAWCDLLGLSPSSPAGACLWRAAATGDSLPAMIDAVAASEAAAAARRAVRNHLALAADWGVFDEDGVAAADLAGGEATVVDLSGLDRAAANAVARSVAAGLYRARVDGELQRLPWLLVDEAHAFFEGVAGSALRRVLTRGRHPGVSLVTATQRPSAVPDVAVSQADLVVAHRLTAAADRDALADARPTYVDRGFADRMPEEPGHATVVDDATETVHAVRVRERATPHGGESPRASAAAALDRGETGPAPRSRRDGER